MANFIGAAVQLQAPTPRRVPRLEEDGECVNAEANIMHGIMISDASTAKYTHTQQKNSCGTYFLNRISNLTSIHSHMF